jgi:hypothetical protein
MPSSDPISQAFNPQGNRPMTPALKASRGTKRRCQSGTCGLPFYDLNRTAIVCPNCAASFTVPVVEPRSEHHGRYSRAFSRPPLPLVQAPDVAPVEDEAIADPVLAETVEADADDILEVEDEEDGVLPVAVEDEPQAEE